MPGARTRSVESPWLALGKSFGQPRGMYRTVGDCTAPLAPCNDAVGGKRRILCVPLCETLMILLMVVVMPKMQVRVRMWFFIIMIMMMGMHQIGIEQ